MEPFARSRHHRTSIQRAKLSRGVQLKQSHNGMISRWQDLARAQDSGHSRKGAAAQDVAPTDFSGQTNTNVSVAFATGTATK
jgi:hypothetical protein